MMDKPRDTWQGWAALLRLPNLFTVPGDAMAGLTVAALAAGHAVPPAWQLLALGGAALCFYVFGLLINDLWDFCDDMMMRPDRPLPSGMVRRWTVIGVMLLLPVAGMGLAWLVSTTAVGVAVLLLPLIVLYNLLLKDATVTACASMGACRALSFLLGVSPLAWVGIPGLVGLAWGVYIALITLVARHEDRPATFGNTAWLPVFPGVVLAGGVTALAWYLPGVDKWLRNAGIPLLAAAFLLGAVVAARRLQGPVAAPAQTRAAIGAWLRNLIPLQSACLFLCPQTAGLGVVLVLGWPAALYFGRRYSAS